MKKKNPLWKREKQRQRTRNLILLLKELFKNFTPIPAIILSLFVIIGWLPIILPNLLYENFKYRTIILQGQSLNLGIIFAAGCIIIEVLIGVTVYLIFHLRKRTNEEEHETE